MNAPVRILHVEDDPLDTELIQTTLDQEGLSCEILTVDTRETYLAAIAQEPPDLILSDFSLPAFDGFSALDIRLEKCPHIPFIFISGTLGEDAAIEAFERGATDYVLKSRPERLAPAIRRALREAAERLERLRMEAALRASEEKFSKAFHQSPIPMTMSRISDEAIVDANERFLAASGLTREELIGNSSARLSAWVDPEERMRLWQKVLKEGFLRHAAVTLQDKHQQQREVLISATLLDNDHEPCILWAYEDITENKRAEAALRLSEARFSKAFHANPTPLLISRINDGQIVDVNQELVRRIGFRRDELIGHNGIELSFWSDPADKDLFLKLLQQQGAVRERETSIRVASGAIREILLSAENIELEGQACALWASQDITERKQAERELQKSRELYADLVNSIEGIVWESDVATFQFSFVSQKAEEILGYPVSQWLTEADFWLNHMHPQDREWAPAYCLRATNELRTHDFEYRMIAADGRVVWLRDLVTVVAEAGHPVRLRGVMVDITAWKHVENELRASEKRFSIAFHASPIPLAITRLANGRFVDANDRYLESLGFTKAEIIGRSTLELGIWPDPANRAQVMQQLMTEGKLRDVEIIVRHKSGVTLNVLLSGELIELAGEKCALWASVDITERKRLEEQFRQAQKMEAIGRLAGGIAHDFNNLLTAILGYSNVLLRRLSDTAPHRHEIEEIRKAGERAAALTQQLLAFSRKQVTAPRPLDLNLLISDLNELLRPLIGEDIELSTSLDPTGSRIEADPNQIEQVIMNLAINARDAMIEGGRLSIETSHIVVPPGEQSPVGLASGSWVVLTIRDTGHGMDAETRAHLFEPFFTTKTDGKGTGLGLATVYGIVQQCSGTIQVISEPGHGATFQLYLPRLEQETSVAAGTNEGAGMSEMPGGTETILLVEDEDLVRRLGTEILRMSGYTVLSASNGAEALQICETLDAPIHLLVTDVVMPQMSGRELAETISLLRPEIKILFVSGYIDDAIVRHGIRAAQTAFVQKPFTPEVLACKVREVIDAP